MNQKHLSIVVAALTRKRPNMVADLIASLGDIKLPDNCDIRCLIVENDEAPNTKTQIENLMPLKNGLELTYVLETEPGIPFARNRAAEETVALGADLMTFVDDDETVDADWLVNLVTAYRNNDAVLVGGPVRVAPAVPNLTWLERSMHDGVAKHFKELEDRANNATAAKPQVVVTNNWLAETQLFTKYKLRFDPQLRFTGGEDSKFCRDVWALDLKTHWVPSAIVYATMPKDRLSFAHQFRDVRDRAITRFHMLHTKRRGARIRLIASVPFKALVALILLVAVPFTGGKTIFSLAATTGWIAGRAGAAFGQKSTLYTKIVGN